jgi:hypothetical protein
VQLDVVFGFINFITDLGMMLVLLIPLLALVFGQATGVIIFGPPIILALIGVFSLVDLIVFRLSLKLFKREEILAKLAQNTQHSLELKTISWLG